MSSKAPTIARALSSSRMRGLAVATNRVMRMCSERRNAKAAPSMESQRKRMPASSSAFSSSGSPCLAPPKQVARDHAGGQHRDLQEDKNRGRHLDREAQHEV